MSDLTRAELLASLGHAGLDPFDQQDVELLVDILLDGYTPLEVLSWVTFPSAHLEQDIPLSVIRQGHIRRVVVAARKLVGEACTL